MPRARMLLAWALVAIGCTACTSAPQPMDEEVARRQIGVNRYLWQATLDTLSFMPLVTLDPHGGVIISDWYAPQTGAAERIKVIVHIADRNLRADGLYVTVFRQQRVGSEWRNAPTDPNTARQLEDRILNAARTLRGPTERT